MIYNIFRKRTREFVTCKNNAPMMYLSNYNTKNTILPKCEKDEYPKLMKFYQGFNIDKDSVKRIKLLESTKHFNIEKQ